MSKKSKSNTLSIYLLKDGFNADSALKENHNLDGDLRNESQHQQVIRYSKNTFNPPWWKDYLGINDQISQGIQGAVLFLTVESRTFAITFGNGFQKLKNESYEYDFGLITTLNSINPKALKSTDILLPENALRRRNQAPQDSDLNFFDIDYDSSVINRLTGKVKDEYKELFSNTTGADNVRLATKKILLELPELCKKLLVIYNKKDYERIFPNLRNVVPIKNPKLLNTLNNALISELKKKSNDVVLTIPDIADFTDFHCIRFSESRKFPSYDDSDIKFFYDFLGNSLAEISMKNLTSGYKMYVFAEDDRQKANYSIYKSLIWDYTDDNNSYHLCNGNWYQISNDFAEKLRNTIDPLFIDCQLPDYSHESEEDYNKHAAENDANLICLDRKNIASNGDNVEPCDLYKVENNIAHYIHVKIGTRSTTISHLLNQGSNSISLINSDLKARKKLRELIKGKSNSNQFATLVAPIENKKSKVIFAIISPKEATLKSKALPLFSRISLNRVIKDLSSKAVEVGVTMIKHIKQT